MKKLAILTALLLTTTAHAADLSRKAVVGGPVAQPLPFAGFYIGATAGYGWGSSNNTASDDYGHAISLGTSPSGFAGGLYTGYNFQFGNVVAGLETDLMWTNIKGSSELTGKIETVPFAARAENRLEWLGTTRARLGYAWGSLLAYGTGGLAYGGVKSDYGLSVGSSSLNSSFAQFRSASETKVGWTGGLGLEYFMNPNLALRTEWLYYDLGDTNNNFSGINVKSEHKGHVVRGGIGWKF